MPTIKRSHSENRNVVCILCFKKQKTELRKINQNTQTLLEKHIICDSSNNLSQESLMWLPTVVCTGCINALKKFDSDTSQPLKHIDYSSLIPPQDMRGEVVTRSSWEEECSCSVCLIGRMHNRGNQYQTFASKISDLPGQKAVEVFLY